MGFSCSLLTAFLSLSIVNTALCWIQCGDTICSGYSAHCCDFTLTECCYYNVYHFWWFWFVWVVIFTLIASCSFCCYRRRRYYRTDYAVVSDAYRPPAYGTVVSVSASPPSYPATQYQSATAPPPAYVPEQVYPSKPPAYIP